MPDTAMRAAISRSTSAKRSAAELIRQLLQKVHDAAEAATSLAALKASLAELEATVNAETDDLVAAVVEGTIAENEPEEPDPGF